MCNFCDMRGRLRGDSRPDLVKALRGHGTARGLSDRTIAQSLAVHPWTISRAMPCGAFSGSLARRAELLMVEADRSALDTAPALHYCARLRRLPAWSRSCCRLRLLRTGPARTDCRMVSGPGPRRKTPRPRTFAPPPAGACYPDLISRAREWRGYRNVRGGADVRGAMVRLMDGRALFLRHDDICPRKAATYKRNHPGVAFVEGDPAELRANATSDGHAGLSVSAPLSGATISGNASENSSATDLRANTISLLYRSDNIVTCPPQYLVEKAAAPASGQPSSPATNTQQAISNNAQPQKGSATGAPRAPTAAAAQDPLKNTCFNIDFRTAHPKLTNETDAAWYKRVCGPGTLALLQTQ